MLQRIKVYVRDTLSKIGFIINMLCMKSPFKNRLLLCTETGLILSFEVHRISNLNSPHKVRHFETGLKIMNYKVEMIRKKAIWAYFYFGKEFLCIYDSIIKLFVISIMKKESLFFKSSIINMIIAILLKFKSCISHFETGLRNNIYGLYSLCSVLQEKWDRSQNKHKKTPLLAKRCFSSKLNCCT